MTIGIPFYQVDAFADRPLTGNPAAVMPLERWLDDWLLQGIAQENNLSETAFTVPSEREGVDYDLRWFTPTTEVELCGHASLAAGHIMIRGSQVRFATRAGVLTVSRAGDVLDLDLPAARSEPADLPEVADALRVQGETVFSPEANGTAILLLGDESAVRAVRPDFEALAALPYLVTVTAPGDEQDIASRVFAAYHGIDEDPVTGAAHAALVPFWAGRLGRDRFTALQASERTGILHCRLEGGRVVLGGGCVTMIAGTFQL